jgi:hypothetical protein
MSEPRLSYNTRKSLCVHVGEEAGTELADLIMRMARRIEELERNKVNVTQITPNQEPNLLFSGFRPTH